MGWRDRVIGIVLGLILGIGLVTVFVFVYSEQTVDAPSLSEHNGGAKPPGAGAGGRDTGPPPVATVRVIGGAPPPSGPAELRYRENDLVRLNVVSDGALDVELLGYGISRAVPADDPTPIRFRASKAGSFPLIVAASHIDVARIAVAGPS